MDLDDFFAKKDRKKNKGKKFATADEIAKKLDEAGKRSEKLKKEKTNPEVDEQGNTVVQDEDEWREFEEEKKDYTGLKIQNLTLADYDGSDYGGSGGEDEEGGMEENEQGEMVPKKKAGPWRVIQNPTPAAASDTAAAEAVQQETPAPSQPPSNQAPGGAYVPPSLRNASRATNPTPLNSKLRRKVAPDVRSEEVFPTLSAATAQEAAGASAWSKKGKTPQELGFEEARNSKSHSGRQIAAQNTVSLGNKYGALYSDQS